MIERLFQIIVSGALWGGVYGLATIGLSLIFGVMGIVNFSQAEFLMLGMYLAYFLNKLFGLDPFISILPISLIFFMGGVALQKYIISPIIPRPHSIHILYTASLMLVIQNVALSLWTSTPRAIEYPLSWEALQISFLYINKAHGASFIVAIAIVIALMLFLKRTEIGVMLRATADDAGLASLVGINSGRVYYVAFGLGISITGLAGVLIALYYPFNPTVGNDFSAIMFVAVVMAGLGTIMGSFIAGVLIGIIQSLSAAYLHTMLQNVLVFLAFLVILIIKPQGLLKK